MTSTLWGIDLGGTKIEGVVIPESAAPEPLARLRVPTEAHLGYEHILSQIGEVVKQLEQKTGLKPRRIGLGHPGALDPQTGVIKNSNTVCLNQKPLKRDLEAALTFPLSMANDANCFALAEALFGAGRGADVVFGVILGTGVGGGVVVNGQVLNGHQGIAGEWGHNVLIEDGPECYCGKRGCVETIISGTGLQRFYQSRTGQALKLAEIVKRAETGEDPAAAETVARLISSFGRAISVIINILDPDCIVLGGGVSNVSLLYSQAEAAILPHLFNPRLDTKIVQHQLGDSAGVFGAALLAREGTLSHG